MEEIRAEAVARLKEMQKIKSKPHTAMELHPRRQMMGRVQRREQRRYHRDVQEHKKMLKQGILDIDTYFASLPQEDPGTLGIFGVQQILPKPRVVLGKIPTMRKTRLQRYKRKGRMN